jgi:hypothetical protein
MDPQLAKLGKSIDSVFILDKSKLSRLLNIIEDKFKSAGLDPISSFELHLKNGKKMVVHDIEHVLVHDNSLKNPVTKMLISYEYSKDGNTNNCEIFYYKKRSTIDIFIKSSNVRWANELFAEIEEQIERILVNSWIYKFKKASKNPIFNIGLVATLTLIVAILIAFLFSPSGPSLRENDFLSKSDIERILSLSQNAKTNDDKIGALFEYSVSRLKNMDKGQITSFNELINKFDLKFALILSPLIIIIISFYYMFRYCYPGSMFLWGDYKEYYNTLLSKRKMVMNTIIITMLIGIIGNLFVYAFSKFFS